jgi:lipopolysaccharide transport system permease protein
LIVAGLALTIALPVTELNDPSRRRGIPSTSVASVSIAGLSWSMATGPAETSLESTTQLAAAAATGVGSRRTATVVAGLVWTLVRTDFKARYHGTLSGFVWALMKPAMMFVVLMSVFSFLFPNPTYKLNLIIGLFLWDFFAEGTKTGLTSLHAKGFLLTKARCPSWILVVTSISNAVLTLGVFSIVMAAFLWFVGRPPTPRTIALFLCYATALIAMVVGFAFATSVLFLRYRDLNQVWEVVIQAGFFFAPIIYPLGIVPERFHFYFYLWPPTPVIEFARAVLVAGTIPSGTAHIYLAVDAAVILTVGFMVFQVGAPRSAEYL